MASGKSLELAQIKPPEPELICICGKVWREHFAKTKGRPMLKKYSDGTHTPAGRSGISRARKEK